MLFQESGSRTAVWTAIKSTAQVVGRVHDQATFCPGFVIQISVLLRVAGLASSARAQTLPLEPLLLRVQMLAPKGAACFLNVSELAGASQVVSRYGEAVVHLFERVPVFVVMN